jgi:hypothetical protein
MGTDWYRMRPKEGAPRGMLEDLIEQQSAFYRLGGQHLVIGEFMHLDPALAAVELLPWGSDPSCLYDHVDYHVDGDDGSRSTGVVTKNPLLPAEWRYAAHRSFLPDQIPPVIATWRRYLEEVRAGGHRDYLRAWQRYEYDVYFAFLWKDFREVALKATGWTDACAREPEFVRLRDHILARPFAIASPAPYWGRPCVPPGPDSYREYADALKMAWTWIDSIQRQVIILNFGFGPLQPFEEWVQHYLDQDYLWDCLSWLERIAADGYGVILDW